MLRRYKVQDDHYLGFYQTWTKTILFLLNRQWLKWNQVSRRYNTDTGVAPWKQQPVTNIIFAVYRTLVTKLSKQRPTLEVVPPSGDSDDREAASLGESVLQFLWRKLNMRARARRGLGWFLCTGQVFARVHWDPDAGKLIPLTQDVEVPHPDDPSQTVSMPCPCDEAGEPIMRELGPGVHVPDFDAEPAMVHEGEIAIDFVDPLSVRYGPDDSSPEDAREMFVGRMWPVHKAMDHFDVTESEITGGEDGEREMLDDVMSSAAAGAGGTFGASIDLFGTTLGASQQEGIGARVLVIEWYKRDDKEYPEGRHLIICGKAVVWPKADDPDYPDGEAELPNQFWPPLIPILSTPIPGQPQGIGTLSNLVALNEQINTLDGKILEHNVLMAMGGKWVVSPDDKGLKITSEPGQKLVSKGYDAGHPPVQAQLKPLPDAIYKERDVLMSKVLLISGLSGNDISQKPEGVTAGRSILALQEISDSVLMPDLEAWEEAYEEIGRRQLVLAQRHYREPRLIDIKGEEGQWLVRSFTGADLTDGLNVRVQTGSSFPWSKSAQIDFKMEMLSKFPGLVMTPQTGEVDQEKLAEFLDVAGTGLQSFESGEDPDLVEVQREHAMFEAIDPARGEQQIPQIAFWQDIPKHLAAHYRFMKRDYARFQRWTPEGQQAFLEHMKQTAQAVDQLAQQAVDAQMPMPAPQGGGEQPPLSLVGHERESIRRTSDTQLMPSDFRAAQDG